MQTFSMVGRLGSDPEVKHLPSGNSVTEFRVAVDQGKDKKPAWRKCVAFGQRGEFIDKWFKKGKGIFIAGTVQQEEWTDKTTGEPRYGDKYVVNDASFVPGERDGGGQREPAGGAPAPHDYNNSDIGF